MDEIHKQVEGEGTRFCTERRREMRQEYENKNGEYEMKVNLKKQQWTYCRDTGKQKYIFWKINVFFFSMYRLK